MDYKERQKLSREKSAPKLLDPERYTETDKVIASKLTSFYSRATRRKKPNHKPDATKKRHKGHKR